MSKFGWRSGVYRAATAVSGQLHALTMMTTHSVATSPARPSKPLRMSVTPHAR